MKWKEDQEGMLFAECMTLWENIGKAPSVRYKAFEFVVKIAKAYPELKKEILFLTDSDYSETLSPAIKQSFFKLKAQLSN